MRIWIDVENAAGVRYGDGPITTASEWQSVRRLDAAGTFSFTMPASDERANLLAHKRIVRCWGADANGIREVGAGVIDVIEIVAGSPSTILVSGDDLLRELANRTVGDLALSVPVYYRVTSDDDVLIRLFLSGGITYTDYTTMPATIDLGLASESSYLQIMHRKPFESVTMTITARNTVLSDAFAVEYYKAANNTWQALPGLVNGTAAAGTGSGLVYPFGVLGTQSITYDMPAGWDTLNSRFRIRFANRGTADIGAFTISDLYVTITEPVADGLQRIMATVAADGWSLDPSGMLATWDMTADVAKLVYMQFAGDSALTALSMLAEQTGEHFILSPSGRRVWWIGEAKNSSGLTALQATELTDSTMLISALSVVSDSYDMFNRAYAFGGGLGDGRLTMELTTRSEAGYTLGASGEYLEDDAAIAEYGRIDRRLEFADIEPLGPNDLQIETAANALWDRTYNELRRKSQLQQAYNVEIVPSRYELYPGQTVRVAYHEWVDGYHAVNIDDDLWVLETTTSVSSAGVRTIGMMVATVDRWPQTDSGFLARLVGHVTNSRGVDPVGTTYTSTGPGVVVNFDVRHGTVMSVKRVFPVADGRYNIGAIQSVRLEDGVIVQVEFGSIENEPI